MPVRFVPSRPPVVVSRPAPVQRPPVAPAQKQTPAPARKPASRPAAVRSKADETSKLSTGAKVGIGLAAVGVTAVAVDALSKKKQRATESTTLSKPLSTEEKRQQMLNEEPDWDGMGPLQYVVRPFWKVFDSVRDFFLRARFVFEDFLSVLPWLVILGLGITLLFRLLRAKSNDTTIRIVPDGVAR